MDIFLKYTLVALVIFIIVFVIYILLIMPRQFNKPDYSVLRGYHYAHRGLHDNQSDKPENSLPAFREAVRTGYGMEFDVQLTKDNIPVVFHDKTLDRMCNVEGNVYDYTLEELKNFSLANSSEKIPTLEEVLEVVGGRVPLIIEYKLHNSSSLVCSLANNILEKYHGVYCVESFNFLALMWYRKNRPEIIRGQLGMSFWREKKYRFNLGFFSVSLLLTNILTRPDFIAFKFSHHKNISRQLCKKLGALSVAWTIRSEEDYTFAKDNFDLFIFDSFML